MSLLIFIVILIALIWVHELGHFSAAKLFGIQVDEFGIGFPPRLLRVRWGETDYTFNLLLVGGFVRIYGEDEQEGRGSPRSMASKPRMVQAAVIVAGITMNLLFGWVLLSLGYMAGMPTSTQYEGLGQVVDARATIVGVLPGSPADHAGLIAGDVVRAVETGYATLDMSTAGAGAVQEFIAEHQDESVVVTVLREGKEEVFLAKGVEGLVEGRKAIGIQLDDIGVLKLPVHLALVQGAVAAKNMTVKTAEGLAGFLWGAVRGVADFAEVAGPIGIANIGASAVDSGFSSAVILTALISINLALINVLPIPGLDGGRLLIIGVEAIMRRPVSRSVVGALSLSGFALIIVLMLLVTYHDLAKLVG